MRRKEVVTHTSRLWEWGKLGICIPAREGPGLKEKLSTAGWPAVSGTEAEVAEGTSNGEAGSSAVVWRIGWLLTAQPTSLSLASESAEGKTMQLLLLYKHLVLGLQHNLSTLLYKPNS